MAQKMILTASSCPHSIILYQVMFFLMTMITPTEQACVPAAGTYCPLSTGDPIPCLAGHYCTGDALADHVACPINTYRTAIGAQSLDECLPCADSYVTTSTGQSECRVCQAGTFYSSTGTSPDFQGTCTSCPSGSSSVDNSRECSTCVAGTYAASGSLCVQCRPGSYSSANGALVCTSCSTGYYTYAASSTGTGFAAVWGASLESQCVALPSPPAPLICLPGSRMQGASCTPCPIGYYCPVLMNTADDPQAVRACPGGSISATTGAISPSDCNVPSILKPFNFESCSVARGGLGALSSKLITAMATSSSTNTVFVTTATAIYRMYLVQSSTTNTLDLLAGEEGSTGPAGINAMGTLARFTKITAIGVDFDVQEATVAVVGDDRSVRMVNVFTRQVTILGDVGSVGEVGGIAIRKDASGNRIAYVSDVTQNRIMAFNLVNLKSFLVAGDLGGGKGSSDGDNAAASFWAPRGIAFIERSMGASKMLLIADSKNNLIRVLDTDTKTVSTWFRPQDKLTPEMTNPVGISVSSDGSSQGIPIIYVSEASRRVSAIQFPVSNNLGIKILTQLTLNPGVPLNMTVLQAVPHGPLYTGGNAVGYNQILVFDFATRSISSLVQDIIANTADGGGGVSSCHIPCLNPDCAALSNGVLCGNSFLDPGEQCDTASVVGSGCNAACEINTTAFACHKPLTSCLAPCPAYNYLPENKVYCEPDCSAIVPRSGYTIDSKCVETDIDECEKGTHNCSQKDSMCINTPGSFQCACFATYFGDGYKCSTSASAVYSVVDIPSLSSDALNPASTSNPQTLAIIADVLTKLKNAYAATLAANVPESMKNSGTYVYNTAFMAQLYTSISLDPTYHTGARIEIVSLFETATFAAAAAAATTSAALNVALSQALFTLDTGVSVFQAPKSRIHRSNSFSAATNIEGWGMNITSVTYNRTCKVTGVTPRGGCWQVEMIYVGGQSMPKSNENGNIIQQSKNLIYLPRIDHDEVTMALLAPGQALTMSAGMYFPCDTMSASAAGLGITNKATACCMRGIDTTYRPHAGFKDFLASQDYNRAAPAGVCEGGGPYNDTFPESDVVYKYDSSLDGASNDLVVGKLDGMPNSEVRLLETIDYTTRTFRVLLVLEEGDLRLSASMVQGVTGVDYSMTFFVGMANFRGTGGSIMSARNTQQYITVSKSNILTISTYGANQDPLVSAVDMQLVRVKVTDFFQPVKYLYYLNPLFTMPLNFHSPGDEFGIVPIGSIRIIKAKGSVKADDPAWQQACASNDGNFAYANQSLQALVQKAQLQECVNANLQMCYPPKEALGQVSFGVPLPENMVSDSDFSGTDPYSVQVQFMINAKDSKAVSSVRSTLTLSVDLTPGGFISRCETMKTSQTLADIISGNIYIGTATTDAEWDSTMFKKVNIDVPGTTPSDSFQFNTTTVQGAVMTFSALGDATYFDDARYLGQSVHMHDIHTVHFLEPLGGKGGASPNFDAVKALFLAGNAFDTHIDAVTHSVWLTPSTKLLAICPYRASPGHMTCLTRSDSSFKDNVVTRDVKGVVELRPGEPASVTELQGIMSQVMMQGGVNDYTKKMGTDFHAQLTSKLGLNLRYRKAYVVNPVMDWSFEAMQASQRGSTAFTVCTKIIAIGMITITSASGTPIARRLLSTILTNSPPTPDFFWPLRPSQHQLGSRSLLASDLSASLQQSSNSMVLDLDVPGFDAASQMCSIYLGADYSRCNIVQLQTQIQGDSAANICRSQAAGTLSTSLDAGLGTSLIDSKFASKINGVALLDVTVDGCSKFISASPGSRRLFAVSNTTTNATSVAAVTYRDYIVVTSNVMLSSINGTAYLNTDNFKRLIDFLTATTSVTQIAGGGYLKLGAFVFTESVDSNGNPIVILDVTLSFKNATNFNETQIKEVLKKAINPGDKDLMFVLDDSFDRRSSSSSPASLAAFGLNVFVTLALASALLLL